ncbi:glycosyl hydrolase [Aspergillus venezuelensis]
MYHNPIIPGFAPDPSIVRIHDTFYLVTSSFHLFPGLPIYASKDLLAWRHVGNAITRSSQLSLAQSATKLNPGNERDGDTDKAPATGGLYAPTIRHHNGVTYIVCTNVIYTPEQDKGDWASGLRFDNFIISTRGEPGREEWSNPVPIDFHGIDPDLFFDDDGRAYISGSSWRPSPSCCIACFEIEVATGRKVTEEAVLWAGVTGVIPEGPHIYKRTGTDTDGHYYLLIAEGGTHAGHCVSIARAATIWGPYEACAQGPILPPADGAGDPSLFCQYNGHGDLVQDLSGAWWMVCLGVRRRDRAGRMVLGRETFLAAVDWAEGQVWPRIQHPVPRVLRRAVGARINITGDAQEACEGDDYCSLRPACPLTLKGESAPSPLSPRTDLTETSTGVDMMNVTSSRNPRIQFRIICTEMLLHFLYRVGDLDAWGDWQSRGLVDTLDMSGQDFTGPVIGVFAVGEGEEWCTFENVSF